MTDVGTETTFRLNQRIISIKSKHLLRSEVSWCDQTLTSIDLHLVNLHVQVRRSIYMLSVTDFDPKGREPFPRSEFTPGSIWTYWMLIDHQVQSDFHVGTTQVDFEVDRPPPANSPTGDLLITMVKEMVILFKKRVRKWKKVVSIIHLKVMKTRNDSEIACDSVKRANVVLHVGLCKKNFSRKHTATHKPTSAQPLIVTTMTHIHTRISRLWSP